MKEREHMQDSTMFTRAEYGEKITKQPEPVEMYLCEINHIILKEDTLYIFRRHPSCSACLLYSMGED